jgi:hypothetical protein
MRHKYLDWKISVWGMSIGLLFSLTPSGFAVTPASVSQDTDVPWSSVVENPFDGNLFTISTSPIILPLFLVGQGKELKLHILNIGQMWSAIAVPGKIVVSGDTIAILMSAITIANLFMKKDRDRDRQKTFYLALKAKFIPIQVARLMLSYPPL